MSLFPKVLILATRQTGCSPFHFLQAWSNFLYFAEQFISSELEISTQLGAQQSKKVYSKQNLSL